MNKGNKLVFYVIIVTVFLSVYTMILTSLMPGTEKLTQHTIRFILTLILSFLLYKGYNPARIIMVVLCLISGVIGLFVSLLILPQSIWVIMILFPSITYLICAAVLMFHPDVKKIFSKGEDA